MTTQNFKSCAIALILDLTKNLAPGDRSFVNEFAIPAVGNCAHECGGFALMEEGNPTVKGSLGGISFAQWTGVGAKYGRRKPFMELCERLKLHPYSYDAAIAMLLFELKGSEKASIAKTRKAVVRDNTPKPKNILMARVVAFELGFERAGVKHYPNRYDWAVKAQEAWNEWVRGGCPAIPRWVSPKARFSADFDKQFGPIVTTGTITRRDYEDAGFTRGDAVQAAIGGPVEVTIDKVPVEAESVEITTAETGTVSFPKPVAQKGSWPEKRLTTDQIKVIQTRMRELGWVQAGKVDGVWSETMVSAVKRMQRAAGATEDGHYGDETRAILDAGTTKFTPPPARAQATVAKLVAANEPTTVAAASVKATTALAGFGTLGAAIVSALGDYGGQAFALVRDAKDSLPAVPFWVYAVAVCLVAYVLYRKASAIQKQRLDEEKSGANNALAEPLPVDDAAVGAELPPADPDQSIYEGKVIPRFLKRG